MGKYLNMKLIMIQLVVVLILFCGGAEAKVIEAGLWGIGWDADGTAVKQTLERQGFVLLDQWKDAAGVQGQRFGNGIYSGFQCDITLIWKAKGLAEINIQSTGVFLLGTDSTFQNLLARFTDEYDQPQEREGYMLKIFPGIWVESAKWTITGKGEPSFEATVVQNRPAPGSAAETAPPAKIYVSFKKSG